jgi:hypothetical protein
VTSLTNNDPADMNFKSSSLCKTRCWLHPSLGLALAFLLVFASECRVGGAAPDLSVDRSLQLFHTRDRSCAIAAAYVGNTLKTPPVASCFARFGVTPFVRYQFMASYRFAAIRV